MPRKKTGWKESVCRGCGESFEYRTKQSNGYYCSNKCQHKYQKEQLVEKWFEDILNGAMENGRLRQTLRSYLIEKAGNCCSQCGWNRVNETTGKCPLEIDHIDGNAENCRPENLRVLCPNCHSLTPTWKALNSGKGCRRRLQYGKLIH